MNEDSISRSMELMGMILESTTKDLIVIQEQLRDNEKATDVTKVEVCFFPERDYIIYIA